MGTLWRSRAEVRELIELSFGVVSGMGSGIRVLDGGRDHPRGRVVFRVLWSIIGLNGFLFCVGKGETYLLVCEKFTIFPYGQCIDGIVIKCVLKNVLCYEIEVGIYEKFAKI